LFFVAFLLLISAIYLLNNNNYIVNLHIHLDRLRRFGNVGT